MTNDNAAAARLQVTLAELYGPTIFDQMVAERREDPTGAVRHPDRARIRRETLDEAITELEDRLNRFALAGRHTRARWAVQALRDLREEGG
jgi:hypothetical protein